LSVLVAAQTCASGPEPKPPTPTVPPEPVVVRPCEAVKALGAPDRSLDAVTSANLRFPKRVAARSFRYGFMGAFIGSLLAAATLLSAGVFAARGAAPMSAAVKAFEPWMVWPLALIPLASVLIAMITVRIAVLQALRRMAY
jgi:hypothetical protein